MNSITHRLNRFRRIFEEARPDRVGGWQFGAALLLILGAKLTLIGLIANPVPYWDQWFAEGEQLFLPYLREGFAGPNFFFAHNEHRIFFTRLLMLAVLELCGTWNTPAEMAAGALVHIAALGSILLCVRRVILPAALLPTAMMILVFAIPFGGENTLWGFQSANYFVILLGTWAVVLTTSVPAFVGRWWFGWLLGVLAIFAMAAAGTALMAAGLAAALQVMARARRSSSREIAGILLLIAVGAALLAMTPPSPGSAEMKPKSIAGFLWSIGLAGGWPFTLPAIGPVLLYLPVMVLLWQLWHRRVPADHQAWRIVALAIWIALQAAGTAYARYNGPIASRYIDSLGLGCVVNVFALVALWRLVPPQLTHWTRPAAAAWLASVLACLSFQAVYFFPRAHYFDPRIKEAQIANIAAYLRTGRFGTAGSRPYSLTYNDLPRLALVTREPLVRGLLPAELGSTPAERKAMEQRLALRGGLQIGWREAARVTQVAGILLLFMGTWLYAFTAFAWRAGCRMDEIE